jgi:hypothetical protein
VAQKSKTDKTCPRAGTRTRTRSEDRAAGFEPEADREVQARVHMLLVDALAHQTEQKNWLRQNWERVPVDENQSLALDSKQRRHLAGANQAEKTIRLG